MKLLGVEKAAHSVISKTKSYLCVESRDVLEMLYNLKNTFKSVDLYMNVIFVIDSNSNEML